MKPASPHAASFTLVEILTATAILSILFTIMFGILQQVSIGWQAANRRVEASQAARLALEQIASDLENCVVSVYPRITVPGTNNPVNYGFGFFHMQSAGSLPWLHNEVNISVPNDCIFVATPNPASQGAATGDLWEAGYIPVFVARPGGLNNMREGRYNLVRHFPATNVISGPVVGLRPLTDFMTTSYASPATNWWCTPISLSTTHRLPFVDNVIRFYVRFVSSNNPSQTFSSWGRPVISGNAVTWPGNPPIQPLGLPMAAEITMCILDERSAERLYRIQNRTVLNSSILQNIPTNMAAIPQENIRNILQNGIISFHRRVYFKTSGN
jgi:type II secretory pathway pseudopilin PulG